jgi:hypothetical protein
LIWIKSRHPAGLNVIYMTETRPPPVRHCPVCGITMQASKSREELVHFDTFNCLSCETSIVEAQTRPPPRSR